MVTGKRRMVRSRIGAVLLVLALCTGVFVSARWALTRVKRHRERQRHQDIAARRFAERTRGLLDHAPANKGEWGIMVADAESGESLFELNSAMNFLPASNLKLFTTALALEKLGPDYRFHTTLESNGAIAREGELTSDLVLVGRGDPNLSNRKLPFQNKEEFEGPPEKILTELADELVSKGVKSISGDIIGDDSYFALEPYPSGWEVDDVVWGYGAAISALTVNDNSVTLTLTPGRKAGDAVDISVVPPTSAFTLLNRVVTSAPGPPTDLALTRQPGAHSVIVSGNLRISSGPTKLVLGIEEPAIFAATMLKTILEQRGIAVRGVARARHNGFASPVEKSLTVLAEHLSPPLRDSVKVINKLSQNLQSELLLRTAMRETIGRSAASELMRFAANFYSEAGIVEDDIVQTDGSGLSRQDLVTPRAVVGLLYYAEARPWFDVFFTSLPIAGVDGTLQERLKKTVAAGRIHGKTGSADHAKTLSGFAETVNGRRLIFSFLGNNQSSNNSESQDVLDGLCVAMIEELNF
jgi:D-alanyl-D-alanine carboxypeptidase/D-alanyl-D-alanine-endopeptidase (penicillin-binding protein 4)